MPLNWNEIKERASQFSKEWETTTSEDAEAKSFWDDFFQVFGVSRRRVATFEYKVPRENRSTGFIDLLWKGVLLVEHKSAGKDLSRAYTQAIDYFPGLKDHELPKYICVCNFHEFRLTDLDDGTEIRFHLKDLVSHVHNFGFLSGYPKRVFKDQTPINIEAAYRMGLLHDELKNHKYSGHVLEVYLVRILFCLFAEDTTIFEKDWFNYFIVTKTKEDGSDLGSQIAHLFQILDTPFEDRSSFLDEDMNRFPYVNGLLFSETLPMASFNSKMRELILACSALDWSMISPAIFGSLFQSTMNPVERRNLGAHYTSEKNIMKVIKPLFLDDLYEEFNSIRNNARKLKEFHIKLAKLKFLDPACGCGNFLVISYRELRILELEILKILQQGEQLAMNIDDLVLVSLDQFYGIEIEEWPCRIAEVAMWLIEHQMNMRMSEELGQYYVRLPLQKSAQITNANALRIDWQSLLNPVNTIDVVAKHANIYLVAEPIPEYRTVNVQAETVEVHQGIKPEVSQEIKFDFIFGNPPFYGKQLQNDNQKEDMNVVFEGVKNYGTLDYVTSWYLLAAKLIQNTKIRVAFVSTNSISQGEQVGIIWGLLFTKYKIKIHFAHRTFKWGNEAKGEAAVHVVIIGFANFDITSKKVYEYDDVKGEPHEIKVNNINPYLVEGKDIFITARTKPLCEVPEIIKGSETTDDGHLMLSIDEVHNFKNKFPQSTKYIRPFIGGGDFINGNVRYCLWLKDAPIEELRKIPFIQERLERVKSFRLASNKIRTRHWANFPALFTEDRQPNTKYLMFPKVSSEKRSYIPFAFVDPEFIINNTASYITDASLYHFGILESKMHMAWMSYVCGRMKSDFIYSNKIVYNNFPWPLVLSSKQIEKVSQFSQLVLDSRAKSPEASLADLYDPLHMPPELFKAHQALDRAVDQCYRPQPFTSESERLEYLFKLYQQYTAGMFIEEKKKRRTKK